MNLALMEPYELDYPESNPQELDIGFATCCTFSHDGSLLFVGLYDGSIVAYDVDSRTVVYRYAGLTRPVISISLTRNNKHMLASCSDGLIHRYNVHSGVVERVSSCPFALKWSQIHPLNPDLAIVSPIKASSYLVNLALDTSFDKNKLGGYDIQPGAGRKSKVSADTATGSSATTGTTTSEQLSTASTPISVTPANWVPSSAWIPISAQRPLSRKSPVPAIAAVAQQLFETPSLADTTDLSAGAAGSANIRREEQGTFAIFSTDGSRIYAGTARSLLIVFDTETVEELFRFSMGGTSHSARHMCFSPDNAYFVVVSSALTAKLFPRDPPTTAQAALAEQWLAADTAGRAEMGTSGLGMLNQYPGLAEINDRVNRVAWRRAMFTRSGEYFVTITQDETLQTLYVWGCPTGRLVAVIRGPQVGTYDLAVHPTRPLVISCADSGMLFLWTRPQREKWSAFSPDFEELNDNVEYFEREDEFDLKVWSASAVRGAGFPDELDQVRPVDVDTPHCAAWSPMSNAEEQEVASEDDDGLSDDSEDETELSEGTESKNSGSSSTSKASKPALSRILAAERLNAARRFKIAQPRLRPEVDPEIILAHERGMKLLRIRNAVVELNRLASNSGTTLSQFVTNLVQSQHESQNLQTPDLDMIEKALSPMKRTKVGSANNME